MAGTSVLDALVLMQASTDIEKLPPDVLFRCAGYWWTVGARHERHGRGAQAKRLFAAAERMEGRGCELAALRRLCQLQQNKSRRTGKVAPYHGPIDPALLEWTSDWLAREPARQRRPIGR